MKSELKYTLFLVSTMPWILYILLSGMFYGLIENMDTETYRLLNLATMTAIMAVLPFIISFSCTLFYNAGRRDQLEEDHERPT